MAEIRISGRTYDLRMDVRAMGEIEKKYGDVQKALQNFRKHRNISTVIEMFVILANSGEKAAGREMNVKDDVLDRCSLADLDKVSQAMTMALDEALHAETVGGNEADDSVVDVYAQELEAREKNA